MMHVKRVLAAGVGLVVVIAVLWRLLGGPTEPRLPNDPRGAAGKPRLPAVAALDVSAGAASMDAAASTATASRISHPVSANLTQFRARLDYAALSARIATDMSPEALYLKAAIYARCARRDGRSADERQQALAAKRATFVGGLSDSNADTPLPIAAYDHLAADPCVGLDLGALDHSTLTRMVATAADAGNPTAQAWQLANHVETSSQGMRGYALDAGSFAQLQQLLTTGAGSTRHVRADIFRNRWCERIRVPVHG